MSYPLGHRGSLILKHLRFFIVQRGFKDKTRQPTLGTKNVFTLLLIIGVSIVQSLLRQPNTLKVLNSTLCENIELFLEKSNRLISEYLLIL